MNVSGCYWSCLIFTLSFISFSYDKQQQCFPPTHSIPFKVYVFHFSDNWNVQLVRLFEKLFAIVSKSKMNLWRELQTSLFEWKLLFWLTTSLPQLQWEGLAFLTPTTALTILNKTTSLWVRAALSISSSNVPFNTSSQIKQRLLPCWLMCILN